jgi:protein SCO1/2
MISKLSSRRALCVALLGLTACSSAPKERKRFKLVGEVVRLNEKNKTALIKHEKIEGWMDAMTMEFPVKADAEWAKLKPGVRITATVIFVEADLEYWLEEIVVQP